nr:prolyl oligopeptidase family serine peptidase [Brevibacterium otitidis]
MLMTTAPYGSWPSPITAADVAAGSEPVYHARFIGRAVVCSARVSGEAGRIGIVANLSGHLGDGIQLLPPSFSARSRVHEYGGCAWAVDPHTGMLFFVNADDQRIYRLDISAVLDGSAPAPTAVPQPLTPATGLAVRYGDLTFSGGRILAVEEVHENAATASGTAASQRASEQPITRSIVALDSSGAHRLASGPRFLAWPRISPCGTLLSFIGWDHPHMPWDETAVHLQPLDAQTGAPAGPVETIYHRPDVSVLQPEWLSRTTLAVTADASGRWQLTGLDVPAFRAQARGEKGVMPAEEDPLLTVEGEIGGPLWMLGEKHYLPVDGGTRLLAAARLGTSRLIWDNPRSGEHQELGCPLSDISLQDYRDGSALIIGGSSERIRGLYTYTLATGELEPVALSAAAPDRTRAAYYPRAEVREFDGVHAIIYPPSHPEYRGPEGEKPPYIAFVHGGPTGQSVPMVSAHHAFFTSRGIGVIDVNYRGSTGYGRAYRDALKGQWGIVDVADTVTAVTGLVDAGLADPKRLAISGGSAGGWTVLRALTSTSVFAAGASYYGVGDLRVLAEETHDFESRYLDGLVGVYPEEAERYAALAPVNLLDELAVPVAIFQGDEDPIVPPSQARLLIDALEARDLPYHATFYRGEAHGFVQPAHVTDSLEQELSFYGRVMGFATPGLPAARMKGRGR